MHFHLPKPLHGWRQFIGEVGIIVVGVLIALGAEQAVDEMRWKQRVHSTNDELKAEVYQSAKNMALRLALQRCLRGQISQLAAQLNAPGNSWKGMPVALNRAAMIKNGGDGPVLTPAYRPPTRLWLDDRWKAAGAEGVLSHFDPATAQKYAVLYRGVTELNELQEREASAASELAYLASDRSLSSADRIRMFVALAEVDRANSLMALASAQSLGSLRAMRLEFDRRQEASDARDLTTNARDLRGGCADPVRLSLN